MERLTEKHYTGDGYYLKCSGVAGCPDSCDDCDKLDEVIERLGSYEDAEEQGRLWITPCKIGDHVWWLHGSTITECRVHRIQINKNGLFLGIKSTVAHGMFPTSCLGKTLFMTREEAEAASAGKGDKDG